MFDGFGSKIAMAQQSIAQVPGMKCHEDYTSAARTVICLLTDERAEIFLTKELTSGN